MKPGDRKTTAGIRGLVPTPTADRPLTKAQEAFRNLLARLESLRQSIDTAEEKFDKTLRFYAAEIVPRIARKTVLQKELVRALGAYFNKTSFPRKLERLEIKEQIQELLDEIAKAEKGLTDTDLREIYGVVHSVDYAEHERKTLASVKAALEKTFAEAGIETDFAELDSATSEADFMAKAEELSARVRKMKEAEMEEAHCRDAGHHSAEDEESRAEEEFRKRSIATIYKQLARVLHPDLERNHELQKQKVELMQELTVAFRQNDLHTLLRLEMQWIQKEGSNLERLTEEKLGVYNEFLARQVEALDKRLRDLALLPRYRPILVWENRLAQTIDGPEKARELDESIAAIEQAVRVVGTAKTTDDVRAAIAPFRPATQYPLI
jgi:hypothetical protein